MDENVGQSGAWAAVKRRDVRQVIPRPHGARPGAPAPWARLHDDVGRLGITDVRAALADTGPARRSPREGSVNRAAAVLAPLFDVEGEAHVILTRRTTSMRAHAGELSFPGGAQDPGETLEDTARREAFEEIALDRGEAEIIGELDHLTTISSSSIIVPYVGALATPPHDLVANLTEVDAILEVPLTQLLDPSIFHEELWPIFGGLHPVVFFELGEDLLWGATAAMVRQLLGFLTGTVGRGELGHN